MHNTVQALAGRASLQKNLARWLLVALLWLPALPGLAQWEVAFTPGAALPVGDAGANLNLGYGFRFSVENIIFNSRTGFIQEGTLFYEHFTPATRWRGMRWGFEYQFLTLKLPNYRKSSWDGVYGEGNYTYEGRLYANDLSVVGTWAPAALGFGHVQPHFQLIAGVSVLHARSAFALDILTDSIAPGRPAVFPRNTDVTPNDTRIRPLVGAGFGVETNAGYNWVLGFNVRFTAHYLPADEPRPTNLTPQMGSIGSPLYLLHLGPTVRYKFNRDPNKPLPR